MFDTYCLTFALLCVVILLIISLLQASEAVAADIACGFGASLLFVLCNPWAGRPEVQPRDPPPIYSGKNNRFTILKNLFALEIDSENK